jgi:enediyne biosynthesis protein E4
MAGDTRQIVLGMILCLGFGVSGVAVAEEPVAFAVVPPESGFFFRHTNGFAGDRHFIETMGPGCAFVDYDGDGHLDIYMVNGHDLSGAGEPGETNHLFHNNGDGSFADVTGISGTGDTGYGMGVAAGDYDNDGHTDLYVTNYGRNLLYRNAGDGAFTDVTTHAGVGDVNWGVGCAFLDYDNDGSLDLYVANYVDFSLEHPKENLSLYMPGGSAATNATGYPHPDNYRGVPDVLYRNRGDGTFEDVTRQAGVFNPEGKGMGMACTDYDNDGDVDIYVGNDLTPNFLYQNSGDGTFSDVALLAGVGFSGDGKMESSMGVAFGDYDRDGFMDLAVPNFQGEPSALYHNDGTGFFSDRSYAAAIGLPTRAYVGWGVGFLDYDNDGALDLFISTGHVLDNVELFDSSTSYAQRNFLFRNNGPGEAGRLRFADVSGLSGDGLTIAGPSRGAAFGDYDNDGDVDILVVNCNDRATLLRNDGGNRQHWLRVRAEGVHSNRDGIGARIAVVSGDAVQIGEVKSGGSLYSQSDLRVSFGLGQRTTVDRIEVRWPSGIRDTVTDVSADRTVTIREGIGLMVEE